MERLQAKIKIMKENGSLIDDFYDRESFNLINIPVPEDENFQLIEIGNIIEHEGQKYRVKDINFKMKEHLYTFNGPNYNCQIGVFVEKV